MKIIYYTSSILSDSDFPLLKAYKERNIDVTCYIIIGRNFKASGCIELDKPLRRIGLIKASSVKGMERYCESLNLDKTFFISPFISRWWFFPGWIIWIWAAIHMALQKTDIFHFTWNLRSHEFLFKYWPLKCKRILTVHDPIMHSGTKDADKEEKSRRSTFEKMDHFILLNNEQKQIFLETYNISVDKVTVTHLGIFDTIKYMQLQETHREYPYILFFGQIFPYKGLDVLLEAMDKVHRNIPELKLIVAGRGKIYFDENLIKNKDYVIFYNRYFGIKELGGLIKQAKFTVCPYRDATQSGVVQTSFMLGTPVIASNVGAMASTIQDKENGLLVPPNDIESLVDAIEFLHNNKEIQAKMRSNISKITSTWNESANTILGAYHKMLEG